MIRMFRMMLRGQAMALLLAPSFLVSCARVVPPPPPTPPPRTAISPLATDTPAAAPTPAASTPTSATPGDHAGPVGAEVVVKTEMKRAAARRSAAEHFQVKITLWTLGFDVEEFAGAPQGTLTVSDEGIAYADEMRQSNLPKIPWRTVTKWRVSYSETYTDTYPRTPDKYYALLAVTWNGGDGRESFIRFASCCSKSDGDKVLAAFRRYHPKAEEKYDMKTHRWVAPNE